MGTDALYIEIVMDLVLNKNWMEEWLDFI